MSIDQAFTSCFISGNLQTSSKVTYNRCGLGALLCVGSLTGVSNRIMKLIPKCVAQATVVGMGLQIALIGMSTVKLVIGMPLTVWLTLYI